MDNIKYFYVIRDEDSVVYKLQCVCKRVPVMHEGRPLGRDVLVQLSVENLEPYSREKNRQNYD